MGKLSISNALRALRQRRIFTILACSALLAVTAQMTLFKGGKSSHAAYDKVWNDDHTKVLLCTLTSIRGSGDNLPVIDPDCEGADIILNDSTVDAGAVQVWQTDGTHEECPALTGYNFNYFDPASHHCVYLNSGWYSAVSGEKFMYYAPVDITKAGKSQYNADGCPSGTVAIADIAIDFGSSMYYGGVSDGKCRYAIKVAAVGYNQVNPWYTAPSTKVVSVGHVKGASCTIGIDGLLPDGRYSSFYAYNDCDSARSFKSLTLSSGAVLTHSNITFDDMNYQDTNKNETLVDEKTITARWKKVDFSIKTGAVVIDYTSQINVDGKGYPGGTYGETKDGSGRGGSSGYSVSDNDVGYAGGAGYGGVGESAASNGTSGGLGYDRDEIIDFDFGSGGGMAERRESHLAVNGGAGGGRIRIEALKFDIAPFGKIEANGVPGANQPPGITHNYISGAGSGGTVYLKYINEGAYPFKATAATYSTTTNSTRAFDGSVKAVNANVTIWNSDSVDPVSNDVNVFARGAGNDGTLGNFSGGGRIYIEKEPKPGLIITKRLIPINRPWNNASVNNGFNAYAPQKDDLIQVEITVQNYSGDIELTDDLLQTPDATKTAVCRYFDGTVGGRSYHPSDSPIVPPAPTDSQVVWKPLTVIPGKIVSYFCKIE